MTFPKKIAAGALALAVLAACEPVKGPDADGITASFANESAKSFVAGYQPAKVTVTQNGKAVDANCKVTSSKYSTASFATPATVNLPAYSQGAVNATLTCTTEAETKSVAFKPKNLSQAARTGTTVGVFILCPVCGLGVAAANAAQGEKSSDVFGFTELKMEF